MDIALLAWPAAKADPQVKACSASERWNQRCRRTRCRHRHHEPRAQLAVADLPIL